MFFLNHFDWQLKNFESDSRVSLPHNICLSTAEPHHSTVDSRYEQKVLIHGLFRTKLLLALSEGNSLGWDGAVMQSTCIQCCPMRADPMLLHVVVQLQYFSHSALGHLYVFLF